MEEYTRQLRVSLVSTTAAFEATEKTCREAKFQLQAAKRELTKFKRKQFMMAIAKGHQDNLAKDPIWNIALAIAICGVLVVILFAPTWYFWGSLVIAAATYLAVTTAALLFLLLINKPKYANPSEKLTELTRDVELLNEIRDQRQSFLNQSTKNFEALAARKRNIESEIGRCAETYEYQNRKQVDSLLHQEWRLLRGVPWEEFLMHILEHHRFSVEMTKTSGDQGVDLVANKNGVSIAIQAKGYANSVGNSAVQQAFTGMKIYGCSHSAVITNSEFTLSACEAAEKTGCILVGGEEIEAFARGELRSVFRLVEV